MDFDQQQRDLYSPIICDTLALLYTLTSGISWGLQMNGGRILNKSTIALQKVYPENTVLKYSIQTLSLMHHMLLSVMTEQDVQDCTSFPVHIFQKHAN